MTEQELVEKCLPDWAFVHSNLNDIGNVDKDNADVCRDLIRYTLTKAIPIISEQARDEVAQEIANKLQRLNSDSPYTFVKSVMNIINELAHYGQEG